MASIDATSTIKKIITADSEIKKIITATAIHSIDTGVVSPFLPSDLAGLFQWIDLGFGVTFNGSDVSAITDRSNNAHNIQQTTASEQPLFIASDQNGLPAMQFDGLSENMISTEASSVWKFLHDGSDYTIYNLIKITDVDPDTLYIIFNTNDGSTANIGFNVRYDDRVSQSRNDRIISFVTKGVSPDFIIDDLGTDGAFSTQIYHIITSRYDNTNTPNWTTLIDNVSTSTDNNTNLPHSSGNPKSTFEIGRDSFGSFLKGSISEWTIFDRILTSEENTSMITYFNSKYAL